MNPFFKSIGASLLFVVCQATLNGQFLDDFDDGNVDGWNAFTGDGFATISFTPNSGFARSEVDATDDPYNVWWSVLRRDVSSFVDMEKLEDPAYELRVEVKLRTSHAPRRVNIMINTQRTLDYHEHLREYDIEEAGEWSTISFTTESLDAKPGDNLYVQLCMTDWGYDRYHMDVDYYKADIVKAAEAGPDLGEPLLYHPPIPPIDSFAHHLSVAEDGMLNLRFPDVSFGAWQQSGISVLTVSEGQYPILRWDLAELRGAEATGPGVLELTTRSLSKGGDYGKAFGEDLGVEFGKVRIFEVFGGPSEWSDASVTYHSFLEGQDFWNVVNEQMIFDTELAEADGGKTHITLSRPVMQRILDGTTKGLLLMPLGAIDATIYDSSAHNGKYAAKLHFSTR
ncbi:hypothetical protein QEH56_21200 [Pelagicoccus enzymogenes]|uniref:hypothetical protein n=1 Tax=Pelagicoccus enzymogenes TaxID=2773457 RepID=UPI00280DE7EB|nr:hypothetical protein [Pelagicoccus enzymogenes]MDQ8200698.1 hypothetical protein [Pelagicoccus enzymogenes]